MSAAALGTRAGSNKSRLGARTSVVSAPGRSALAGLVGVAVADLELHGQDRDPADRLIARLLRQPGVFR
jgi:hypothetical protein